MATALGLSSDGSVLGAVNLGVGQYPDKDLTLFSVPTATPINDWPSTDAFSLSLSGTTVGRASISADARYVTNATGNMTILTDSTGRFAPVLSPDGTHIALSSGTGLNTTDPSITTLIYQGSMLVNAVPGHAVGWIDDGHLLVQTYKANNNAPYIILYDKSQIYDALGNLVASPPLPVAITGFDAVSSTAIYPNGKTKLYDAFTGAQLWSSPFPLDSIGAAAGSVIAQAHQQGVYVTQH